MPLSRYQLRNVYSLADPELYRAADKDDPEALLEGVAMAGLVGVLRQLGDLAEFAAEIFRGLHEEVMATAARGHGLLVRVQQLESEFPSIERAFLSQPCHSTFFTNSGIDWHPNLQMEQNLITKGDLPRFVMDSYEECRGPPRLFLLDKFDVAGAGACLKRYTDPSFYKVEATSYEIASAETQRDKKIRKTKKKGSRWKKEETRQVLLPSHAKLHQLFQEEHMQNGVIESARRVKLKKRPNKFPLDLENGKSYMERLLKSPSEDKLVHEVPVGSSTLRLPSNNSDGSGFEILEVSMVSPALGSARQSRSPCVSPSVDKTVSTEATVNLSENTAERWASELPTSSLVLEAGSILFGGREEADEKHIAVDEQIKTDGTQDGYLSDDVASVTDNYVDTLATIESEIETDAEYRAKIDPTINQETCADTNVEQLRSRSSVTASDDGNSTIRKGITSFSYPDSTSAGNTSPGGVDSPPQAFACTEIPFRPRVTPNQVSITEKILVTQHPEHEVSNDTCIEVSEIPSHRSATDAALTGDQGAILKESTSREADLNKLSSDRSENLDSPKKIEEHQEDLADTLNSTSKLSDFPSPATDKLSSLLFVRNPEAELDDEDPSASSSSMVHLPNMLDTTHEISESSVTEVNQAENAEDNCRTDSVNSQCSSPCSVISHVDEQPSGLTLAEFDICDPDAKPSEATFRDDNEIAEETTDTLEQLGDDAEHKSFSAEATISCSSEDETQLEERGTELMNSETKVATSAVFDPADVDGNGNHGSSTLDNETELEVRETESINTETKTVTAAEDKGISALEDDTEPERGAESVNSETEANVSVFVPFGVDKNEDDGLSTLEEPNENGLVINQSNIIQNSKESCEKEEVDQHLVISPELVSVPCETESYENSSILLLDSGPNSPLATCGDVNEDDVDEPSANLKIFEDQSHSSLEEANQNGLQAIFSSDLDCQLDSAPFSSVSTEAATSLLPHVTAVSSISKCIDQDLESKSLDQVDHVDKSEAATSISSYSTPLEDKVEKPLDHVQSSSESCSASVSEEQSMMELPQTSSRKVNLSDQVINPSTPVFSSFGTLPQLAPINLEEMPPLPPLPPMQWRMGKLQNTSSTPETDGGQHSIDHFPPISPSKAEVPQVVDQSLDENINQSNPIVSLPDTENQKSQHAYEDLAGGVANFRQMSSTETSLDKHDNSSISSEVKAVKIAEDIVPQPAVEREQSHDFPTTSDRQIFWPLTTSSVPPVDEERPNGIRPMKIQRPRSPLIDAVAAHDKSKLRKVSERDTLQIPKEDEKNTILEQIRAKSFNLKPAVQTRPSIQGPQTNLRVAAILEKANAIRQALVGSDDDDDDSESWSDS